MNLARFRAITGRYNSLRVSVLGDFCLDRYLEIDPARREISLETKRPVHNVVRVRSQPGAAGTILNNLVALGVREIHAIGFAGEDGEGFELRRALASLPGVNMENFLETPLRQTFTYTKPLLVSSGKPPRELSRLDRKNWTRTPPSLERALAIAARRVASRVDAMIVMDQVDQAGTGVVTRRVLDAVRAAAVNRPRLLVLADSRRTLRHFPSVCLKMNRVELARLSGKATSHSLTAIRATAAVLARSRRRPCFVTLEERGILAASPGGDVQHSPALPVHGEIDIVGAGDAVTANLTVALAAGASLREAMDLANAAASEVVHQLGTTGTASVKQLRKLLFGLSPPR